MRVRDMRIYAALGLLVITLIASIILLDNRNDRLKHELERVSGERDALIFDAKLLRDKLSAIGVIDAKYNQELRDAKNEIDELRDRISAGTERVFVRASCPAAVPTAASSASVVNGGAVELSADAREDYLRLRRELEEDRVKILGLQAYIKEVCLNGQK